MKTARGYIFDIDGTLIDSNDSHAQAWVDAFGRAGLTIPFANVRPLIGMGGDMLLKNAAGLDKEEEPGKTIASDATKIFKEKYLSKIYPFDKTRELFDLLRSIGAKIVIASSADEDLLEALLKIAKVEDRIDGITKSSQVQATKPAPDLIEAARALLDLTPDQILMIGDTKYDIEAASGAGIEIIAFTCGGTSVAELGGAVETYDGPADYLRNLQELTRTAA